MIISKYMKRTNCLRCGHEWFAKTDKEPLMCPRCKSYYYKTKRRAEADENTKSAKASSSFDWRRQ